MQTEQDEIEFEEPCCQRCGGMVEWQPCWKCFGNGGWDDEDLMSEDPLWFKPGDYERCDECGGKGGWDVCLNSSCKTTGV